MSRSRWSDIIRCTKLRNISPDWRFEPPEPRYRGISKEAIGCGGELGVWEDLSLDGSRRKLGRNDHDGLGKEARFAWQIWGCYSCIVIGIDQYITLMSNLPRFLLIVCLFMK
jgi:hypothetical protein